MSHIKMLTKYKVEQKMQPYNLGMLHFKPISMTTRHRHPFIHHQCHFSKQPSFHQDNARSNLYSTNMILNLYHTLHWTFFVFLQKER